MQQLSSSLHARIERLEQDLSSKLTLDVNQGKRSRLMSPPLGNLRSDSSMGPRSSQGAKSVKFDANFHPHDFQTSDQGGSSTHDIQTEQDMNLTMSRPPALVSKNGRRVVRPSRYITIASELSVKENCPTVGHSIELGNSIENTIDSSKFKDQKRRIKIGTESLKKAQAALAS